jgi:hypothetical protein
MQYGGIIAAICGPITGGREAYYVDYEIGLSFRKAKELEDNWQSQNNDLYRETSVERGGDFETDL